jgi:hypothetical protein
LFELRDQLAPTGPLQERLGQQLIVYVFTTWEHEYRGRLAAAHACKPTDIKVPLLGDLRLLRHDILHHRGVASSDNSGRCEVLGHWVKDGEDIVIGAKQVNELWHRFPWGELEKAPLAHGEELER